jgi:uncharacterized membrane protein
MRSSNVGCFGILGLLIAIGAIVQFVQTPGGAILTVLVIVGIALGVYFGMKNKKETEKAALLSLADKLEAISKDLKPIEPNSPIALKTGEDVYFESQPVGLIEYRSTGSTYSGMNQGVSVPIVKGVRYSVGGSSGTITRNPEQLTQIDTGKAIFTNQRIIFVGPNMTREWDLNKLVDMTSGPNGQTISISVSNRQKTSGLSSIGRENITPGFYASIIQQLHSEGSAAAKKNALFIATSLRELFVEKPEQPSGEIASQ